MSLGSFRRRPVRRRWVFGTTALAVAAVVVFVVASASGVLTGSPSKFESGNDPTLGLGNMTVDTAGNTDWVSVTSNANYVHLTDKTDSTDDSFVSGQKQDTVCPEIDTSHSNPPKDDFSDIASFSETSAAGDTYLYGATIRQAPNGNASENIELKQGPDLCPGSTLLARKGGDKLIAIDYNGGGKKVNFHVLTWIDTQTEPCFVGNDVAPCWGSTVLELSDVAAEGGVNGSDISAANNPISNVAIKAGQFAEFGINLAAADILPRGTCKAFPQSVWESRASGASFVSTTKDIKVENKTISNCGEIKIIKRTNPRGGDQAFGFTTNISTANAGSELTCTADTTPATFTLNDDAGTDSSPPVAGGNVEDCTKVHSGTYTLTEDADPNSGWTFDNFSCTSSGTGTSTSPSSSTTQRNTTITLGADGVVTCIYTNKPVFGAIKILKNSTKTSAAVKNAGAQFSYDNGAGSSGSVTDDNTAAAPDEAAAVGVVCVSGLVAGSTYTITETSPPSGYGAASGTQTAVATAGTNCGANQPTGTGVATFTNPPLANIRVQFADGGSGETSLDAPLDCDNTTGTESNPTVTGWDSTLLIQGVQAGSSVVTVICTIKIDP
jgi:hypothetical protein